MSPTVIATRPVGDALAQVGEHGGARVEAVDAQAVLGERHSEPARVDPQLEDAPGGSGHPGDEGDGGVDVSDAPVPARRTRRRRPPRTTSARTPSIPPLLYREER